MSDRFYEIAARHKCKLLGWNPDCSVRYEFTVEKTWVTIARQMREADADVEARFHAAEETRSDRCSRADV